MKIDAPLIESHEATPDRFDASRLAARARQLEQMGFDGIWMPEAAHDPFPALAIAAATTSTAMLGTGIAVALARNPMSLAYAANDVQMLSRGRFVLGLGSQVKAHIERRFGMPWTNPVERTKHTIEAVRAIWASWAAGSPPEIDNEFSTHTLMPPLFSPGPNPFGPPPIYLAGVSQRMTEAAGELCDGFCAHSFTSSRYLREVTLPALRVGRQRSDDRESEPEIYLPLLVATGTDDRQVEAAKRAVGRAIAFYAATPSYRKVLAIHGWESLHDETSVLARARRWDEMTGLVDDDVMDAFAIVAEPERVGDAIARRYGGLVHRVSLSTPYPLDDGTLEKVAASCRKETT